jgi:hypothetical protein
MNRLLRRMTVTAAVVMALLVAAPGVARGEMIPVGFISYDSVGAGTTYEFTLTNLTGEYGLPLDFLVTTLVTFEAPQILYHAESGDHSITFDEPLIGVASTLQHFTSENWWGLGWDSAQFSVKLKPAVLQLKDGTFWQFTNSEVLCALWPDTSDWVIRADAAPLQEIPVPEPASLVLLATGVLGFAWCRHMRGAKPRC